MNLSVGYTGCAGAVIRLSLAAHLELILRESQALPHQPHKAQTGSGRGEDVLVEGIHMAVLCSRAVT